MKKIDNHLSTISNESVYKKTTNGSGVFIDIETTGLSREKCSIYLVGILYPVRDEKNKGYTLTLLFAEDPGEEKVLLIELSALLKLGPLSLITFNGRHFDLPFLIKRYEKNALKAPDCLSDGSDIDIYARLRPFRRSFGISSLNQKSLEKMLGIQREDKYSGKELISVYYDYVKTGNEHLEELLLTHNRDDVLGMTEILPALSYERIFTSSARSGGSGIEYAEEESHLSFDGTKAREFVICFDLPEAVPKPHLFHNLRLFLESSGNTGVLRIPFYEGELKHYFDNYRDYLYIPSQDKVVLKEIGSLMEKTETDKATPSNCCIKTEGLFLPLPNGFSFPGTAAYRKEYKSKAQYVLFGEEIKRSPLLGEYLAEVLKNWFK